MERCVNTHTHLGGGGGNSFANMLRDAGIMKLHTHTQTHRRGEGGVLLVAVMYSRGKEKVLYFSKRKLQLLILLSPQFGWCFYNHS